MANRNLGQILPTWLRPVALRAAFTLFALISVTLVAIKMDSLHVVFGPAYFGSQPDAPTRGAGAARTAPAPGRDCDRPGVVLDDFCREDSIVRSPMAR